MRGAQDAFPASVKMTELQTENKLIKASKLIASGNFDALGRGASNSVKRAVDKMCGQTTQAKPARPTPWFHRLYSHELTDLGELLGSSYAGIYSPGYTDETVNKYLHGQFRDGAENHAYRYTQYDGYEKLFRSQFANLDISCDQPLTVLDVG